MSLAAPRAPAVHRAATLEETAAILEAAAPRFGAVDLSVRARRAAWNAALGLARRIAFAGGGTESPRSVCVLTVGTLGDSVVRAPAVAALRARYPAARITLIANVQGWGADAAAQVWGAIGGHDRLVVLEGDPLRREGRRLVLDERLAGERCDLFVNLSPFGNRGWVGAVWRELILARRLGARRAVGFRVGTRRSGPRSGRVQFRHIANEPRRAQVVLGELGIGPVPPAAALPAFAEAAGRVGALLSGRGLDGARLAVVNPGAKFGVQRWPAERFARAAARLRDEAGLSVAVTGSAGERELCAAVAAGAGGRRVASLAGETPFPELVALLRAARLCVTNDTGTMHVAAITGCPTVAVFSPRHTPTHWFPAAAGAVRALFALPSCRDCYDDACPRRTCIDAVGVDDVMGAARELLGGGEAQ